MQVLNQIKGLSEAKIDKMLEAARKLVPTMGWQSAMTYGQIVNSLTYEITISYEHNCLQSYL